MREKKKKRGLWSFSLSFNDFLPFFHLPKEENPHCPLSPQYADCLLLIAVNIWCLIANNGVFSYDRLFSSYFSPLFFLLSLLSAHFFMPAMKAYIYTVRETHTYILPS